MPYWNMTFLISLHTSCTILNAKVELSDDIFLKGLTMIFSGQKHMHESFAEAMQNIYNQKKQQNSHKIAEIMRKTGVGYISLSKQCFLFPKMLVLLCVVYRKKRNVTFENVKKTYF